ncbi:hypothetical protein QUA20_29325 [Microcoleus sp. Pol7_A1]|uniref:hypothetical protein n=1 Tax=Microcoleus sp. Pol7_A1 TaxID=2818893 RepID=UPI002FD1AA5D
MEPSLEEMHDINETIPVRARYFLPLRYLRTNIFIFVSPSTGRNDRPDSSITNRKGDRYSQLII